MSAPSRNFTSNPSNPPASSTSKADPRGEVKTTSKRRETNFNAAGVERTGSSSSGSGISAQNPLDRVRTEEEWHRVYQNSGQPGNIDLNKPLKKGPDASMLRADDPDARDHPLLDKFKTPNYKSPSRGIPPDDRVEGSRSPLHSFMDSGPSSGSESTKDSSKVADKKPAGQEGKRTQGSGSTA